MSRPGLSLKAPIALPLESPPVSPSVRHLNAAPDPVFRTLDDLRRAMTRLNAQGQLISISSAKATTSPARACGSTVGRGGGLLQETACRPAGTGIGKSVRYFFPQRCGAPAGREQDPSEPHLGRTRDHRDALSEHAAKRAAGAAPPSWYWLEPGGEDCRHHRCQRQREQAIRTLHTRRREQSNESGSASYEHVNHANALNAELDNTGGGILLTALGRALRGEPDPAVALHYDYRKVDMWPRGVRLRDMPIYAGNEIHGWVQRLKAVFGLPTDHTKSRRASKISTQILDHIERQTGQSLRLDNQLKRAVFLYFTRKNYELSLHDNDDLRRTLVFNHKASPRLSFQPSMARRFRRGSMPPICFLKNACIRHGYDAVCARIMSDLGAQYHHRRRISRIYFEAGATAASSRAVLYLQTCKAARRTACPSIICASRSVPRPLTISTIRAALRGN